MVLTLDSLLVGRLVFVIALDSLILAIKLVYLVAQLAVKKSMLQKIVLVKSSIQLTDTK